MEFSNFGVSKDHNVIHHMIFGYKFAIKKKQRLLGYCIRGTMRYPLVQVKKEDDRKSLQNNQMGKVKIFSNRKLVLLVVGLSTIA